MPSDRRPRPPLSSNTVLITGFGPFPGARFNPTAQLARHLARLRDPRLSSLRRVAHVFDVSYAAVDRDLARLVDSHRPVALVMFGLAMRARSLRVESRARNTVSALWPDAAHGRARTRAIAPGDVAIRSFGAPAGRMLAALRGAQLPAALSQNAGRYVCNYLSWRALEAVAEGRVSLAVFIHVPPLMRTPRRAGLPRRAPSWTASDLTRAGLTLLGALRRELRPVLNHV